MSETTPCPKCKSEFTYADGELMICTQCFHEWNPQEEKAAAEEPAASDKVIDANGNELHDGDSVVVIKDLPVKGSSKPIKGGTKVKNIRLVEGDHNISCKVDGFGAIGLKSEYVRKV